MIHEGSSLIPRVASLVVTSLVLASGGTVTAQTTVSNPNQIEGTIELTNTNPSILSVLGAPGNQGFSWKKVKAESIQTATHPNPFDALLEEAPSGLTSTSYQITVEAGDPIDGMSYDVSSEMELDGGTEFYRFAPQSSGPVHQEPAPDVQLDLSECATLLHVRWRRQCDLAPDPVFEARIEARRETAPGSGSFELQAWDEEVPTGTTEEYLALRSGAKTEVTVSYKRKTGSSPWSDQILYGGTCAVTLDPAPCDQVVVLDCFSPCLDPGGPGSSQLGEIVGEVDVQGECEHPFGIYTFMKADRGPHGNFRNDAVQPTPCAEGNYHFPNLLEGNYAVWGDAFFRLQRRYQWLRLPHLGITNPPAVVTGGQTTDLQDTFVLDPGYVEGTIRLAGPAAAPFGSLLEDVYRASDQDTNNDGIPDDISLRSGSYMLAVGDPTPAAGATLSSVNGYSTALFEGSYDGVSDFLGDYEIVLGGLEQEPSRWNARRLSLRLKDSSLVPEEHQDSRIDIVNHRFGIQTVVPGASLTVPHRYCFSEVRVEFETTVGSFYDPRVEVDGHYTGIDFEGNPADYTVGIPDPNFATAHASGVPTTQAQAGAQGMVTLPLPQGSYTFQNRIRAVNPGGGVSDTRLPSFDLEVGCRQVIEVQPGLKIDLDPVPDCSQSPTLLLTGQVVADEEIAQIHTSVNGSPPTVWCSNCGKDPTFSIPVILTQCVNQVQITAVDVQGSSVSITTPARFDDQPPVLQCPSDLPLECNTSGGVDGSDPAVQGWLQGFSASDNCGIQQSSLGNPSFYPAGCAPGAATPVLYEVTDTCGNVSSCSPSVVVQDTTPPTLQVPPPLTLECNTTGGVAASDPAVQAWLASPSATDICEGAIGNISHNGPGFYPYGCDPASGSTFVDFLAGDSCGNQATNSSSVIVLDTTPPVVDVQLDTCCLWPPNHKLHDVGSYSVTDVCDATAGAQGVSVPTDEHPSLTSGAGGASHCADAVIGAGTLSLRAERSGPAGASNGRVYGGIFLNGADSCGNAATGSASTGSCAGCPGAVCVPHDQNPKTPGQSPGNDPNGSCPAIDDGLVYDAADPTCPS